MRYVMFDLETAPILDAATYIEPATAPSNYKDPVKIAEYIRQADAEAVAKAALDPALARIVALGYTTPEGEPVVMLAPDEESERDAVRTFFREMKGATVVGFNCLSFDIPVLLTRARFLEISAPMIKLGRYQYQHPDVIDLMTVLNFDGAIKSHSLAFYTHRFGLPVVQDDVTGADIGQLVIEGQWDQIENHCRADVLRTQALARRIGAVPSSVPQFTSAV